MIRPMYDPSSRRWSYVNVNSFMDLGNNDVLYRALPIREDDVYFHLDLSQKSSTPNIGVLERSDTFYTRKNVYKRFLVDRVKELYPSTRYVVYVNDPVNLLSAAAPTSDAEAFAEASNVVGSVRAGFKRLVVNLGETLNEGDVHDLSTAPSSLPWVPDAPADPSDQERVYLLASDTGYKFLVKSGNSAASTPYATELRDITGSKTIIWKGDEANFKLSIDRSTANADTARAKYDGVETVLNSAYSAQGSLLGTVVPDAGSWSILNITGRNEVRSDVNGAYLNYYASLNDSAPTSQVKVDTVTGNVVITAGTTTVTVNKDGDVTIKAGSGSQTVDGDLTITGNLSVTGSATLSSTLTVSGDADLNGNLNVQGQTSFGA